MRACAFCPLRSVPLRSYSPLAGRGSRRRRRASSRLVSSRVYAASFPTGPRACMDDTRARADEDIALDSSRLRSSARLGSAAAAVTATAATVATTTSSAAATTCRVARRKKKKRRRQRVPASNDVAAASRSATTSSSNAAESTAVNVADVADVAADAVVVLEPDAADAAETDPAAARVDKLRSRLLGEQQTAAGGEAQQLRVGGSGSRAAAASSVGTAVTLLNRRAGKRSPRRCNAGGRRSAMTMDLQRLINEVHARPAIWDQKNVNYHNRDVILKMWREIARACEVSSEYEAVRTQSRPIDALLSTCVFPSLRCVCVLPRTCTCGWLLARLVGRALGGWDTLGTSRLDARSVTMYQRDPEVELSLAMRNIKPDEIEGENRDVGKNEEFRGRRAERGPLAGTARPEGR